MLIGYDKLVIYNNSIPDTENFRRLFTDQKTSLEVVPLNYLPNLLDSRQNNTYFRHMEELYKHGQEFSGSSILYWGIENMAMNECLFGYSNRAHLLLVIDNDETFIAPKLAQFANEHRIYEYLSDADMSTKKSVSLFGSQYLTNEKCRQAPNLRLYLEKLYAENNVAQDDSLYLPQVLFLKEDLVEEIFVQLEILLGMIFYC